MRRLASFLYIIVYLKKKEAENYQSIISPFSPVPSASLLIPLLAIDRPNLRLRPPISHNYYLSSNIPPPGQPTSENLVSDSSSIPAAPMAPPPPLPQTLEELAAK
jgi:hypothetical protein